MLGDTLSLSATSATDIPLTFNVALAAVTSASLSDGGLPPVRPRAFAASSPASVRSRMIPRSNSARAANRWKTRRPPLVVVSTASVSERKPMPRASRSSTVVMSCFSDRASLSSRQTTAYERHEGAPHPTRPRQSPGADHLE